MQRFGVGVLLGLWFSACGVGVADVPEPTDEDVGGDSDVSGDTDGGADIDVSGDTDVGGDTDGGADIDVSGDTDGCTATPEICDGLDNDCDTAIDEGCDDDGDDYCDDTMTTSGTPAACPNGGGDCADGDGTRHPAAGEIVADGIDQDCDGVDTCYDDGDGDGFGTSATHIDSDLDCTNASSGEAAQAGDCDDASQFTFPGAAPNDDLTACMLDADGDDFGHGDPSNGVTAGTDCDDGALGTNPDGTELTADDIDQDCDGHDQCYVDGDHDGYGTAATLIDDDVDCGNESSGEAAVSGDCKDDDEYTFPGATDTIDDGADQDCDGGDLCFADLDGDGHGSSMPYADDDLDCSNHSADESDSSDDCDDTSPAADHTFPGAAPNDDPVDCLRDVDGDDYGDSNPGGGLTAGSDCDDQHDTAHPGGAEVTGDGIDQDCDGFDQCFYNYDGDEYGIDTPIIDNDLDCTNHSSGESAVNTDCNDDWFSIHPGAPEYPDDTTDQDCDGGDMCFADVDDDNRGGMFYLADNDLDCADESVGEANTSDDCDDLDPQTFPGAAEKESDQACMRDTDEDGYGDSTAVLPIVAGGDCNDGLASQFPTDGCAQEITIAGETSINLLHTEQVTLTAQLAPVDLPMALSRSWNVVMGLGPAVCNPSQLVLSAQVDTGAMSQVTAALADPFDPATANCGYRVQVVLAGGFATDAIDIYITHRAPTISVANAIYDPVGDYWHMTAAAGTTPTVTVTATPPDGDGDADPMSFAFDYLAGDFFGCGLTCPSQDLSAPFTASYTFTAPGAVPGGVFFVAHATDSYGGETNFQVLVDVRDCVWVMQGGDDLSSGTSPGAAKGTLANALDTALIGDQSVCIIGDSVLAEDLYVPRDADIGMAPSIFGGFTATGNPASSVRPTLVDTGGDGLGFEPDYDGVLRHLRVESDGASSTTVLIENAQPQLRDVEVVMPPGPNVRAIDVRSTTAGSFGPTLEVSISTPPLAPPSSYGNCIGVRLDAQSGYLFGDLQTQMDIECTGVAWGIIQYPHASSAIYNSSIMVRGAQVLGVSALLDLDDIFYVQDNQQIGATAESFAMAVAINSADGSILGTAYVTDNDFISAQSQTGTATAVNLENIGESWVTDNLNLEAQVTGEEGVATAVLQTAGTAHVSGQSLLFGAGPSGYGFRANTGTVDVFDNGEIAGYGTSIEGYGMALIGFPPYPVSGEVHDNEFIFGNSANPSGAPVDSVAAIFTSATGNLTISDNTYIIAGSAGRLLGAGIADGFLSGDGTYMPGNSQYVTITGNQYIAGGVSDWNADLGTSGLAGCSPGSQVAVGVLLVGSDYATVSDNHAPDGTLGIYGGQTSIYQDDDAILPPTVAGVWTVSTSAATLERNAIHGGVLNQNMLTPELCVLPDERPMVTGLHDGVPAASGLPRHASTDLKVDASSIDCALPPEYFSAGMPVATGCVGVDLDAPVDASAPNLTNNIVAATAGNFMIGLRQRQGGGVYLAHNLFDVDYTRSPLEPLPPAGLSLHKWAILLEDGDAVQIDANILYVHANPELLPAVDEQLAILELTSTGASNIFTNRENLFFVEADTDPGEGTSPTYVSLRDTEGGLIDDYAADELMNVPGIYLQTPTLIAPPGLYEYAYDYQKRLMRLRPDSPAIDASTFTFPAHDIDGQPRPAVQPDIGPDEYLE